MPESFRQYPLVLRALDEVRASPSNGVYGPESLPLAERTAEILKDNLAGPREAVMAAGVLLYSGNDFFNRDGECKGEPYGPDVAAIVLETWLNPYDGDMDPRVDKRVLQIYTACQIAQYEEVLRAQAPGVDDSRALLGDLRQLRREYDRDPWLDIGAPRLQALEREMHQKVARVLEKNIFRQDSMVRPPPKSAMLVN